MIRQCIIKTEIIIRTVNMVIYNQENMPDYNNMLTRNKPSFVSSLVSAYSFGNLAQDYNGSG